MSFGSFPLASVGLTPSQLAACEKAGYTTSAEILLAAPSELNKKLRNLTSQNVASIVSTVARAIVPRSSRVSDLLEVDDGLADELDRGFAHGEGGNGNGTHGGEGGNGIGRTGTGKGKGKMREGIIATGDAGLDEVLRGGLRLGTLTEIAGESAAGKSHLAMSLSLSSQIPSLSTLPGGAIILTSERELSTDRLVQLAKSLLATHQPDALAPGGGGVKSLLDNVHTNRCGDVEALDHALSYMVPHMLRTRNGEGGGLMGWNCGHEGDEKSAGVDDETLVEPDSAAGPSTAASRPASSAGYSRSIANPAKPEVKPIRLIILDSITALFRGGDTPFSSTSAGLAQRSKYLCSIADKLKALAVEFNIAILVINQVSDVFSRAPAPTSTPTSAKPSTPAPVPLTQYQASQPSSSYDQHQFYAEGPEPPMLYATQARWFSGQTDVLAKEASLGIVWANCVNVRVMLSRTGRRRRVEKEKLSLPSGTKRPRKGYDPASVGVMSRAERETEELSYGVEVDDDDKPALIRRFHLVFSPFAPPATIDYIITSTGLHTLEGSSKPIDQASALKRNEKKDARKRAMAEDDGSDAELEGGVGDATQLSDGLREGIRAEEQDQERRASFDSEFGGEVFDDLGDLPAEFWEGRFGEGDGVEGDEELVAE